MANGSVKKPKSIKGVFEHPAGSGIWWINYYVEGKRLEFDIEPTFVEFRGIFESSAGDSAAIAVH